MTARLFDFIWPRSCAVCSSPSDRPGRFVCSGCLMRLPFVPADGLCRKCGRDAPALDGEFLCSDCSSAPRPRFDRAGSVFRFEGKAREMINAFKFDSALHLRNDFVDFLEAYVTVRFKRDGISAVVPMPSALPNRFWRGYNQSHYLARALAKRLGIPYCSGAIRRKGFFKRQSTLSEEERRKNVAGTFHVTAVGKKFFASLPKGAVLVVDDIMTTGSTLSECAGELKKSGVSAVWCVTLARSVR